MRVSLGSTNPAKLEAVRFGLSALFGAVTVAGRDVPSGVGAQPLGLAEIVAGARNRARGAYAAQECDLAVGIEDGLVEVPGTRTGYMNIGCCCLFDGKEESLGLSAGFEYPSRCVARALGPERVPVGTSFDELFHPAPGFRDPGPGAGNIGRLTGGILTRVDYGAQAVFCAAVRILHPEFYGSGS
jgi:inosine/xanthosine triphosphatase